MSIARKKEEFPRNRKAEETAWRGWAFVSVNIESRKTGETEVNGTGLREECFVRYRVTLIFAFWHPGSDKTEGLSEI